MLTLSRPMPPFNPLAHFDYGVLDRECRCDLCVDWRLKHRRFHAVSYLFEVHGKSCTCVECKRMRRLQREYLAALNRRDLYCEMSWHASHDPSVGSRLMDWIKGEIKRPDRTEGWWSKRAPYQSMGSWYSRFQYAMMMAGSGLTAAVSGISL